MIRLVGDGVDESWRAPAHAAEPAPAVGRTLARARQAADWTASRLGRRHRLGSVCVGVDEALCARVSAPSPSREVVAAAMDQREQEWSPSIGVASVEALAPPRRSAKAPDAVSSDESFAAARRLTVLELRDGPVRLWLDELDRRGVSAEAVLTLWHALAAAWAPNPSDHNTDAVVMDLPGCSVWSWSYGGGLIAAGSALKPSSAAEDQEPGPPLSRRITLDWLSWASQLGLWPERIVVVGIDPDPIARQLRDRCPDSSVEPRRCDDPLAQTLRSLAQLSSPADDPRACVTDLTHRPGRAHRWLAVWSALAILLFSATIGGFGFRQRLALSQARDIAGAMRQSIRGRVKAIEPALADNPSPARALRSVLAQEREKNRSIEAPAPPRPMFAELARLSGALSAALAGVQNANVRSIKLDEVTGEAQVAVPDFATGEAILEQLRKNKGRLRWSGSFVGAPPTTQRLRAVWEDDDS